MALEASRIEVGPTDLARLCGRILQNSYKYIHTSKDAPKDIQRVINEVSSLKSAIEQLEFLLDGEESGRTFLESLATKGGLLQTCHDSLQEMHHKLESINQTSSIKRRLLWPLEDEKFEKLLQRIEKQKTLITLAIAGDSAKALMSLEKGVHDINTRLSRMELLEDRKGILDWIKGVDPSITHGAIRLKHEPGTGGWFLNSRVFNQWIEGGNKILWLNGIPGAGKTVLSSTVIEYLTTLCKSEIGRISYYYFDFRDHPMQTMDSCIRSLTSQFVQQSDVIPSSLRDMFASGKANTPNPLQLTTMLIDILNYECHDFVVVDALDECKEDEGHHERRRFFEVLQKILDSVTERCSIFITSRSEIDIIRNMTKLGAISFDMQYGLVDEDIRSHVRSCIAKEAQFDKWPLGVKSKIEEKLTTGSRGMFRWAACQLDTLKRCFKPAHALRELDNLPRTLDETYSRIIQRIPPEYQREIQTIFILLAFSVRPVTIQEVAEATAINLEAGSFSTDDRFPDSYDILGLCSSLVSLSTDAPFELNVETSQYFWPSEVKVLQFAHFTVKEFILSERARQDSLSTLILNASLGHRYLAEMCLIYLLEFSGGKILQTYSHEDYPLIAYAAIHWMKHLALVQESDRGVTNALVDRIFDLDDDVPYINYRNLYDPITAPERLRYNEERSTQCIFTQLHYACRLGLLPLVKRILAHQIYKNRDSEQEVGLALNIAVHRRDIAVTKCLLEAGIDLNDRYIHPRYINPAMYRQYSTPLLLAVSHRDRETVTILLDAGAHSSGEGGRWEITPLYAATERGDAAIMQLLIERGANVITHAEVQRGANRNTLLEAAIESQNYSAVQLILDNGADINDRRWNRSPGYLVDRAISCGNIYAATKLLELGAEFPPDAVTKALSQLEGDELVKQLLDRGADPNAQDSYRSHSGLYLAVMNFKDDAVRWLLEGGADPNTRDYIDGPILQLAAKINYLHAVTLLLEHGADVNAVGGEYSTALQAAIISNNGIITDTLLDAGADFGIEGGTLGSPLQAACFTSNLRLIRTFLERGAEINTNVGPYGSPLQTAAYEGYLEVIELLLEYGADVNLRGVAYGCPLRAATDAGRLEVVKLLLRHGADINLSDESVGSPLQTAAYRGHLEVVKLLLKHGADVSISGGDFGSALQAASCVCHNGLDEKLSTVKLLLENGADVHEEGGKWGTALQAAAFHDFSTTELLLKYGADPNSTGGLFGSPINAAKIGRVEGVVQLLVHYGAVHEEDEEDEEQLPSPNLLLAPILRMKTVNDLVFDQEDSHMDDSSPNIARGIFLDIDSVYHLS